MKTPCLRTMEPTEERPVSETPSDFSPEAGPDSPVTRYSLSVSAELSPGQHQPSELNDFLSSAVRHQARPGQAPEEAVYSLQDIKMADSLLHSGSTGAGQNVYENVYFELVTKTSLTCAQEEIDALSLGPLGGVNTQQSLPCSHPGYSEPEVDVSTMKELAHTPVSQTDLYSVQADMHQDFHSGLDSLQANSPASDTIGHGERTGKLPGLQPHSVPQCPGPENPLIARNFQPIQNCPSVILQESKSLLAAVAVNMADSGIVLAPCAGANSREDLTSDPLKVPENACVHASPLGNTDTSHLAFDFSPARQKLLSLSASSGFNSTENLHADYLPNLAVSPRLESASSPLFSPIYFQPVSFKNLSSEYPVPPELDRKANQYLKLLAWNATRRRVEAADPENVLLSQFADADPPPPSGQLNEVTFQSEESLLDMDLSRRSSPPNPSVDIGQQLAGIPFEELDRLTQLAAGARPKARTKGAGKKRRKKKPVDRPRHLEIPATVACSGVTLIPSTSLRSDDFSSSGDLLTASGDLLSPSSEDPFDDNFR